MAGEAERLRSLGKVAGDLRPHWQVMASPGGRPFCLLGRRPRTQPGPVSWGPHRSRLVQVRIDSPPDRHDDEVRFWRPRPGDDGLTRRSRVRRQAVSGGIDAEVERLVGLGAERLWPGHGWYALCDPTGLVFCVTGNSPEITVT